MKLRVQLTCSTLLLFCTVACGTRNTPSVNPIDSTRASNSARQATRGGFIAEYDVPTAESGTNDIVSGTDGNLWFTEQQANKIGRLSTAGSFAEYTLPVAGLPGRITRGPGGNVWFTAQDAVHPVAAKGWLGSITPSGQITMYQVPDPGRLIAVVTGADGNLWYTNFDANLIGRMTPAGVFTDFPILTPSSGPRGIEAGPDGNIWFTEQAANQIGKMSLAGAVTEYSIPTADSFANVIRTVHGMLFFQEAFGQKIARITVSGQVTEIPLSDISGGFVEGPDSHIWFTLQDLNSLNAMNNAGQQVKSYAIPTAASNPTGVAIGSDGNLWILERGVNKIGVFVFPKSSP